MRTFGEHFKTSENIFGELIGNPGHIMKQLAIFAQADNIVIIFFSSFLKNPFTAVSSENLISI